MEAAWAGEKNILNCLLIQLHHKIAVSLDRRLIESADGTVGNGDPISLLAGQRPLRAIEESQ